MATITQRIDWHDIDSLPEDRRDGRDLLLWIQDGSRNYDCAAVGFWGLHGWCESGWPLSGVTHWADIPPPECEIIRPDLSKMAKVSHRRMDFIKAIAADWKLIDGVPDEMKDGREVLLCAGPPVVGRWFCGDWNGTDWVGGFWVGVETNRAVEPTHWADVEGPGV